MLSRLKFEIVSLVNEILDRLPAHVWTSETTTFLDPAMAGGQFIREIVNRLRKHGWSDDNIAKRVYGLADTPLSLNFVKNKYNIPGTFSVGGIEQMEKWVEMGIKFDVVVGNPPYQDSNKKSKVGSGSTLWINFALKAYTLTKSNGIIAFITPQSWMKPNHKVLTLMKENTLIEVVTTIKNHFPGINSTFSYWILQNTPYKTGHTINIDGITLDIQHVPYLVPATLIPIHKKLVFDTKEKFNVEVDWTTAHTQQLSTSFKTHNMSRTQTLQCKYPVYHTNTQILYCANKTKHFDDKKVMFTDSGYFKPFYDNGTIGSTERCKFIVVKTEEEGKTLVSVLLSKVYQFIVLTARWSGFIDNTVLKSLPKVDLSRSWTDEELYKHFNLTEDEIKLIEETIK